MRILYIEDHPVQSRLLATVLELAGYNDVKLAKSGEEGIEITYEWQPEIILMDLRMPGISGFETIQKLKSDPAVSDIPIIVISARADGQSRDKALQAGAAKVLIKPINTDYLLGVINQLVSS